MPYKAGDKYLRKTTTGVVFPYSEAIATIQDMEVVVAVNEDTVVLENLAMGNPVLNPTYTPEKKTAVVPVTIARPTRVPTMIPVDLDL